MRSSRMLAALALLLVWLGALPATGAAAPPPLQWQPCFVDQGPFQCATLLVPLDYARQRGPRISIALTRLPATDPAHRIGSLLLNPGGPGGSGIDYVVFAGPELYTPEVRARFDLVGFDPRGIARSTALRCFGTANQAVSVFAPFPFPMTRD